MDTGNLVLRRDPDLDWEEAVGEEWEGDLESDMQKDSEEVLE